MLEKLTIGQQVQVPSLGFIGAIVAVQNDGMLGVFRTPGGSRFTVFAGECEEAERELDHLEELECQVELDDGVIWKKMEAVPTRKTVSSYVSEVQRAEREWAEVEG